MFEGIPSYPDASRCWQVIEKHKVNIFYTAPTAIRALMGAGPEFADKYEMPSLRLLGSVGEPINPEAWLWYHKHVGKGRCEIIDTWWQTETGGHMITPLPGAIAAKPGSATKPFFGVQPVVLSPEGKLQEQVKAEGVLAIADSWPGQMRTVYGDHQRFVETYFSTYKGYYFTGDGCRRDADGYYWITGRVDDVLNVSGPPAGYRRDRERAGGASQGLRGRGGRLSAQHQGAGDLRLCHPDGGRDGRRCAERRAAAVGAEGDRRDRVAGPHPVHAGTAEDAVGQDHAADFAQGGGERVFARWGIRARWPIRAWWMI